MRQKVGNMVHMQLALIGLMGLFRRDREVLSPIDVRRTIYLLRRKARAIWPAGICCKR